MKRKLFSETKKTQKTNTLKDAKGVLWQAPHIESLYPIKGRLPVTRLISFLYPALNIQK